jgi:putative endonuclease
MPQKERTYYVYIMASLTGTLYTGFSGSVYHRALQHKAAETSIFTKKYGCNRLVHYEVFHPVGAAIERENEIKGWSRKKKIALIESENPKWDDLTERWGEIKTSLESPAPSRKIKTSGILRAKGGRSE